MRLARRAAVRSPWLTAVIVAATVAPAAAQDAPRPDRQVWALLAGIERYDQGVEFPPVRNGARDAADIARWLIEEAGWAPDHVRLLSDLAPEEWRFRDPARRPAALGLPTRKALDDGIRWLGQSARKGDLVLIFFAGQAVSLPANPDDGPGRPPRDYLIPWDARTADLDERTGWRLGDALRPLATRGDLSIVCLLDTSPAGRTFPPRMVAANRGEVPADLRTRMLEGIARWPGVTAWMAATDKVATATNEGNGLLTSALIRALGTRAEALDLHASLHRLRRDRGLAARGFRTVGQFPPGLSLWPGRYPPALPKLDPLLQRGHADRVTALAFRGDGGRLLTASMDSTLRVWRTSDSFLIQALPWTSNGYWSMDLAGDGRLLVAGGGKGDVLFYDAATETRILWQGAFPHTGNVVQASVLPDFRHAVTRDSDRGRCAVWEVDVAKHQVRQLEPAAAEGAHLLAASNGPLDPKRPDAVAFALAMRDANGHQLVRTFGVAGKPLGSFEPTPPEGHKPGDPADWITAMAVSDAGDRVVLGTESGRILEHDARDGRTRTARTLKEGAIRALRIEPMWLMAAFGRTLAILPGGDRPDIPLTLDRPIQAFAAAAGGRRVAAVGEQGQVRAWEIDEDGRAAPIPLGAEVSGDGLSLAFSPDGDVLAVGDGSGQVRAWRVPDGDRRPEIPGASGRIGHLAASADGRRLLQVNDDRPRSSLGRAVVWRLDGEQDTQAIPGTFFPAGGFLPDGRLALIDPDGNVVLHGGPDLDRLPVVFRRPAVEGGGGLDTSMFASLAISRDGRRIAACSGDDVLACVWTVDGQLMKTIRGHQDKIRALAFSGDGRRLLTAGDDGQAAIWDIENDDPSPKKPERLFPAIDENAEQLPSRINAAAFSPADASVVGLGRQDGTIELWQLPGERPRRIGPIDGGVKALTFSSDGKWMAAAGDAPRITLIDTKDPGLPVALATLRGDQRPLPHHTEMITGLAFLDGGKRLASASLDATIRLWDLEGRQKALLGTLSCLDDGGAWVAYTPDGVFDASREGARRVTWRLDPDWWPGEGDGLIARFDQLGERYRRIDLADALRKGEVPTPSGPGLVEAPRLVVEPASPVGPKQRRVVLRIRSSTPDLAGPRLYHNGASLDLEKHEGVKRVGGDYEVALNLVHGKNEFYALAGRPSVDLNSLDSPDALSNRIELDCQEPTPGRLHIVAIGISKYKAQALRFAHRDAEAMAEFVRHQGKEGTSVSDPLLLLDDQVTTRAVEDKFEELRKRVRGRPEDRVIVFMAGHATVRRDLFCLLLPGAELPNQAEAGLLALRGPVEGRPEPGTPLHDPTVLPYTKIYSELAYAEALQRLVIVDACQAEAIFNIVANREASRRSSRRLLDNLSRRARTSYILATRKGERAAEPAELEHGLLTYALLKGLGEPGLRQPPGLGLVGIPPNADLNRDGWIQAGELRRYAGRLVPVLAGQFQGQGRGIPGQSIPEPPASIAADVDDEGGTFRLVETPPARP